MVRGLYAHPVYPNRYGHRYMDVRVGSSSYVFTGNNPVEKILGNAQCDTKNSNYPGVNVRG
jgi:hypothetical protein